MTRPGALVGIDIGTSAVKVLACALDGTTIASGAASYPLDTARTGYVEQDAEVVYAATMRAVADIVANVRVRGAELAAIGFSCAMHGVLPVDARGETLGPLVTWMDRRSAPIAERWRADGTGKMLYAATGVPVHPMLPSCKVRWFVENDPAYVARAAKFVSLKELIIFRWTGDWLVDWGIASGTGLFDVVARNWSAPALHAAGIDASKLCALVPPSTTLRTLHANVADALGVSKHVSIVLASSDGALANLGVGAIGPDDLASTLGTSGAIRVVTSLPAFDADGRTFVYAYDDTRYIVGGATNSAGAVLEHIFAFVLAGVPLADRFSHALARAQQVPPGSNGVTVIPFLSGERAPYWLPELRGGIVGLDLSTTSDDIVRAAFEGVVFALASVREILPGGNSGQRAIRLSGGLTHAPFVRQLIADVFACEAVLANQLEASAFGAAMMAGIVTGAVADDRAVASFLKPLAVHYPVAASVTQYGEIFGRYQAAVAANLPLYRSRSAAASP